MKIFWVLTYMDVNDRICQDRFDNEDDARSAWYIADRALFLDEVRRIESAYI